MSVLEKLRAEIRTGETRIELDDMVFLIPDGQRVAVLMPAHIEIRDSRLRLHLREPSTAPIPKAVAPLLAGIRGHVVTLQPIDCYCIEARTADAVAVRLEGVSPVPSQTETKAVHANKVTHIEISFERIYLIPEGTDALDGGELKAEFAAIRSQAGLRVESSGGSEPAEPPGDTLRALIPNVKLKIQNAGLTKFTTHPFYKRPFQSQDSRCLIGRIAGGDYCLEATDDGDLAVHFDRPITGEPDEVPARAVMMGLLTAVGLLHGCNPWPYYFEHCSDHRVVERWIKGPSDCQRDCLEPMALGPFSKEAERFFMFAAEFFIRGGDDADHFKKMLWLMREACRKGVPMEVRLLTLCSVLEGLYKRNFSGGEGKRERWQLAFRKAGLDWDTGFDLMFDSWDDYRNKLAHGFDPHPTDKKSPDVIFNAYSRITAGIYILMAKRMGFKGQLWRSCLEGRETITLS